MTTISYPLHKHDQRPANFLLCLLLLGSLFTEVKIPIVHIGLQNLLIPAAAIGILWLFRDSMALVWSSQRRLIIAVILFSLWAFIASMLGIPEEDYTISPDGDSKGGCRRVKGPEPASVRMNGKNHGVGRASNRCIDRSIGCDRHHSGHLSVEAGVEGPLYGTVGVERDDSSVIGSDIDCPVVGKDNVEIKFSQRSERCHQCGLFLCTGVPGVSV